jgi:hypothetical protein
MDSPILEDEVMTKRIKKVESEIARARALAEREAAAGTVVDRVLDSLVAEDLWKNAGKYSRKLDIATANAGIDRGADWATNATITTLCDLSMHVYRAARVAGVPLAAFFYGARLAMKV